VEDERKKSGQVNRTAKASVFEDLFSDKNNLLKLYRVLHPEDVTSDVDDLKHVTLKNILTRGRYNDLGFMVGTRMLILVEAQSTWSVNIIPRCIMYLAETWNRYFVSEAYDVYGPSPVVIPEPELYVIYSGEKEIDRERITLSEEFYGGKKIALDAAVKVLKYDGGTDIIDQYIMFCKTLDRQRELHPNNKRLAVKEAIHLCIEAGVLQEYLQNRTEEVVSIMLTLYDQEQATQMMLANERKESRREGIKEGIREGIKEGVKATVELCQEFGRSMSETAAVLIKKFGLTESASRDFVNQYWKA